MISLVDHLKCTTKYSIFLFVAKQDEELQRAGGTLIKHRKKDLTFKIQKDKPELWIEIQKVVSHLRHSRQK